MLTLIHQICVPTKDKMEYTKFTKQKSDMQLEICL